MEEGWRERHGGERDMEVNEEELVMEALTDSVAGELGCLWSVLLFPPAISSPPFLLALRQLKIWQQ